MNSTLDKKAIRAESLAVRAKIDPAVAAAFGQRLARLGPELATGYRAHTVSVFWSIGDELPTHPLCAALVAAGFVVGLPVTGRMGSPLTFRRWTPETQMVPGKMNIPEPAADAAVVVPDLLFVPLAAFDRRGHRIGYGAGFYDRTLAALRAEKQVAAIGLAYAAQEVLFVPADDHDEPLDMVVTERDAIVCVA